MYHSLKSYKPVDADIAALLLRFVFGGLFVYHGFTKIMSYNQILPYFQDIIGIGVQPSFILLILAEFGCGLLVLFGLFTRLAVWPIFISMAVAFFIAHAGDTFDKKELSFVFLLLSMVVFFLGSGKYSLDRYYLRKMNLL